MVPVLPKRTVVEAERPLVRRRSVEVEFAEVPKEVVGVQANEPPPPPSSLPSQSAELPVSAIQVAVLLPKRTMLSEPTESVAVVLVAKVVGEAVAR
jgi:hypothetical protein